MESAKDLVVGYHGTSKANLDRILREGFYISRNSYDWLGDGVYFFERGLEHAHAWAEKRFRADAAVVEAHVDLDGCMDLADGSWSRVMGDFYDQFLALLKKSGRPLPVQANGANRLDRQVINFAVEKLAEGGTVVRSVRHLFMEGSPIYPGSALFDRAHVQLAVRDLTVISGVRVVDL